MTEATAIAPWNTIEVPAERAMPKAAAKEDQKTAKQDVRKVPDPGSNGHNGNGRQRPAMNAMTDRGVGLAEEPVLTPFGASPNDRIPEDSESN